jgi:iron complex outermembrane receptor protein
MKNTLRLVALVAVPFCVAQTATPSDSNESIKLPTFTVQSARANPYRATDSLSAARTSGALIDTPATVNVITREFFEDIGANSMLDATQYVSGIANGRLGGANGIAERQSIRGFENDGRTIDNFASGFQANLDPALYERVEIVKGPNAILAPTGTPGGSLNVITKSPQFTPANSVSLQVGNYFAQKLTIDSTGRLAGPVAYRLIAAGQNAETYVPGRLKQWNVNPQFAWQIAPRTLLTLKYSYVNWSSRGAASNPGTVWIVDSSVANGAIAPSTPAAGFAYRGANGVPDWANRSDELHRVAAEFTTALGDHVSMRLAASYLYDHFNIDGGQDSFPSQNNRYNPATGIYTPDQTWALNSAQQYVPTFSPEYDPTNVTRVAQINPIWDHDLQIHNDYAGNFNVGPVSIRPLAGAVYRKRVGYTFNETAALPSVNLFAQDNNPTHPDLSAYKKSSDSDSESTQEQLYGFVRLGFFSDRLFATGGAARIWLDSSSFNRLKSVTTPLNGHKDTYLGGLLYKFRPNVAAYASYSTNAALTSFNNEPLWREGKQSEFGIKTEFFDQRLSFSACHFQITQTNLVTPNPVFLSDPVNNPPSLLSNQTSHGYEADMVGGITKDLTVLASFTMMTPRDAFGRRPRNIPDRLANLLLKYDFHQGEFKGLGLFAGVNHVGTAAGENPITSGTALGVIEQVSFYLPARTILNVGGTYRTGRYRFNLNVDNALNKKTVYQGSSRFNMSPFPGTAIRLTTTVDF